MRTVILLALAATLAATMAMNPASPRLKDGEHAGEFDYYVLALSWSPNWCALQGDAKGSRQCDTQSNHGWILHGLWPQYHRGWPSYCSTSQPNPSRALTKSMADIMATTGLAKYQWKKHGTCSGLSAEAYFTIARYAYHGVIRPAVFRKLDQPITLPAALVEQAFLKSNLNLDADMLTITCREGYIQEARICLAKDLTPVTCGRDVIRDCTLKNAQFDPVR